MHIIINFSGGKDSCAMLAHICEKWPDIPKTVIFADTGWEHQGAEEWCRQITEKFGLPLHVVRNPNKDFFSMTRNRRKFPSPAYKICTSDLKRNPIETWIRRNIKDILVVNAMGLRAQESPSRRKKPKLSRNRSMTNSKRTVWTWLPIHSWTEEQVLQYLKEKDIPLHPVYQYLSRFSCQVCIHASKEEIRKINENNPEAIKKIAALEQEIDFTMKPEGDILSFLKE